MCGRSSQTQRFARPWMRSMQHNGSGRTFQLLSWSSKCQCYKKDCWTINRSFTTGCWTGRVTRDMYHYTQTRARIWVLEHWLVWWSSILATKRADSSWMALLAQSSTHSCVSRRRSGTVAYYCKGSVHVQQGVTDCFRNWRSHLYHYCRLAAFQKAEANKVTLVKKAEISTSSILLHWFWEAAISAWIQDCKRRPSLLVFLCDKAWLTNCI